MNEIIEEINKKDIGKYEKDIFLNKMTTYKVGGLAKLVVYPKSEDKLIELIKSLRKHNVKYKVLGNGSNVICSDKTYDGVIIKLNYFDDLEIIDNHITVGAGYSLMKLTSAVCKKGLAGLEFAAGIPGTIGGAIFMNAGAYKSDMGYVVTSVKVLTPDLRIINLTNKEMNFHYRTSFLQKNPGYICLSVKMKLVFGDKKLLEEVNKDRRNRRRESQPLEYPSAGSVFRNPEGDFAGRLIEELNLKGLKKGGAQISPKHANFVVNIGGASATDIKELIEYAHEKVKNHYKIDLKIEQEFVNWE